MLPWGIPLLTRNHLENFPLTPTHCFLLHRKFSIHFNKASVIPYDFNLFSKHWCGKFGNAVRRMQRETPGQVISNRQTCTLMTIKSVRHCWTVPAYVPVSRHILVNPHGRAGHIGRTGHRINHILAVHRLIPVSTAIRVSQAQLIDEMTRYGLIMHRPIGGKQHKPAWQVDDWSGTTDAGHRWLCDRFPLILCLYR